MIQIPDQSGIQMVELPPVVEWPGFRMAKQDGDHSKTGQICPVLVLTSLDRFI
jgi:hypothetical protein